MVRRILGEGWRVADAAAAAGFDDMTPAQARIAARIGPHGTRLTDLAVQALVTKQTAGHLVDQLERAGYVRRVPDPTDKRARLVQIAEHPAALPRAEGTLLLQRPEEFPGVEGVAVGPLRDLSPNRRRKHGPPTEQGVDRGIRQRGQREGDDRPASVTTLTPATVR